jgi:ATP-dependent DNA ligase
MRTFPTLYKSDSKSKIRQWNISAVGREIHTVFGEKEGKLQETVDVISEGKNIGKKNETSPESQAEAEALAKWEKQVKKGYTQDLEAAKAGEVDEQYIEGGIVTMLAHKFSEHGHKLKFPVYVSPKLDGLRCVAIIKSGKATLWTRNRKPITGVPHIAAAIAEALPSDGSWGDFVLDGELYNHDYRNKFEEIVSFVRNETPKEGHEVVEFHVFDMVGTTSYTDRLKVFRDLIASKRFKSSIVCVEQEIANDSDEMLELYKKFRDDGYEGAMVRNPNTPYEHKRSYGLLKMKEFLDDEFVITGAELGRGKLSDAVAAFVCQTAEGKIFRAKMEGSYDVLREFAKDDSMWKGKKLTVCYQNLTDDGIPRFPIGKGIRDDA